MKIQKQNLVWHLDATGSIIKNIPGQSLPFLFSTVMHDPSTNTILPVYEFISTSHNTTTISKYLFSLKKMEKLVPSNFYTISPLIVTDFSWPLISSVLETFNKCNINQYLNLAYQLVIDSNEKSELNFRNYIHTRIYLCSTHFLKMVIKKCKVIHIDDKVKRCFMFCFTLLQNSINIKEFENYLINIFNLFNQKSKNKSFLKSLILLKLNW